jgi:hypothetical protein
MVDQNIDTHKYCMENHKLHLDLNASMVASAGETDRDLAWTQLTQKLGVYNIIEFN